jgi:hypothetical protein
MVLRRTLAAVLGEADFKTCNACQAVIAACLATLK